MLPAGPRGLECTVPGSEKQRRGGDLVVWTRTSTWSFLNMIEEQREERFCKPRLNGGGAVQSTRFLYVAGIGDEMGSDKTVIRDFFGSHGELDYSNGDAVDMPAARRYCYISFVTVADAERAMTFVNSPECTADHLNTALGVTKIIARYAVEKSSLTPASEMECTSSERNRSVHVPGSAILPDFISEREESELLNELAGSDAAWKETLSRRVQHFGFQFNYRTLMLDYNKPTPPLPPSCAALAERFATSYAQLQETGSVSPEDTVEAASINQLTINEYLPGQGIAPHTDTETCLGPVIFILNLGSDIVMALTKAPVAGDASAEGGTATLPLKKLLHLPARSLLVLSGEARYGWQHGIAPRRNDKIDGQMVPRGRRVSLTFRQALKPGAVPASLLQPGELELDHVVRVYDNIAIHWNHTRGKRKVYWHRVKDFLDALPVGTLMADVGCGDGKYFGVNPGVVTIGCDRSIKLLEVSQADATATTTSREARHETFCCDAVKVPLTSDTFDATLCIAVLHHLSTVDRRYSVISELVRITKPGGAIMIQAWALEQGGDSKRQFESQDTMVPWRLNKRFLSEEQQQHLLGGAGAGSESGKTEDSAAEPVTSEREIAATETTASAATVDTPTDGEATQPSTDSGRCRHVTEESGDLVFQRYCHVYKEGELEALCSSVPGCVVVESGWDKGNWFVQLQKVAEERVMALPCGPESKIPVLATRTNH